MSNLLPSPSFILPLSWRGRYKGGGVSFSSPSPLGRGRI